MKTANMGNRVRVGALLTMFVVATLMLVMTTPPRRWRLALLPRHLRRTPMTSQSTKTPPPTLSWVQLPPPIPMAG